MRLNSLISAAGYIGEVRFRYIGRHIQYIVQEVVTHFI